MCIVFTASKAFDRVNHTKLFSKLLELGVPKWIIKVLAQWYCNQSVCVRWGSVFSDFFLVNNGVRQGGILSPLLFNVYINELSVSLSKLPVDCCCCNNVVNHLMYADDTVLFAPSAKGLQRITDVSYIYGCDNDILFNSAKSQLMFFLYIEIWTYEGYYAWPKCIKCDQVVHLSWSYNYR